MPNLVNPYILGGAPPPLGIARIAAQAVSPASTASPAITIDGYTPTIDDFVLAFISSTSGATMSAAPSGWINPLGGTTISTPADGTVALACIGHVVVGGDTNTFTFTGLWNVPEVGEVIAAVFQNVNPVSPFDAAASAFNAAAVTPHVLAGILGTEVDTGSMVGSAVIPDAFSSYATPAGWSLVSAANGTNQGGAAYQRDALTTSGVNVDATNVVPSPGADEYASITVALAAA